jgi:hypothetical protein
MTAAAKTVREALNAVMDDIGAVGKDQRIESGPAKYAYRSIETILARAQPAFVKHGVVVVPRVLDSQYRDGTTRNGGATREATLTVQFDFVGPDGSTLSAVTIGEATDTSDKASNKAMTAAFKYALLIVFAIPTEHDDQDEERIERGHTDQPRDLDAEAREAGFADEAERRQAHNDARKHARSVLPADVLKVINGEFDNRWPLTADDLAAWSKRVADSEPF